MFTLVLGFAGFVLYLLYDINSFLWQCRTLRLGFFGGTVLIAVATGIRCVSAYKEKAYHGMTDVVLLVLSILAFAAMIYCLFFALPFQETYTQHSNGRRTYTFGAYAICRHPVALCFWAMYLFLGFAALPTDFLLVGALFSTFNTGYVWFQDRVTFPKTFCDYEAYRKTTPFLIPTKASIRRARQTWGHPYEKEEKL